MVDLSQKLKSNLLISLILAFTSFNVFAEEHTNKIPKWKLEHQANVANSSMVCASPRVSKKINSNIQTTGFYTLNVHSDVNPMFIDIDSQGQVVLQESQDDKARNWLLTHIGGAGYDIATCYQGKPVCLTIGQNEQITISKCDDIGFGAQTWWFKGYSLGQNKGAWFFGNDGVGQMDCLVSDTANKLSIQQCNSIQKGWDVNRVTKPKALAATVFPEEADFIQYQCESGASVSTYYDIQKDEMYVSYGEELLRLSSVISGSGAKFGNVSQPWGWWTAGERGYIYQTVGDEAIIEHCQELTMDTHDANRVWTAYQPHSVNVSIADCNDSVCADDLGMLIQCQGPDTPALATVYVLPQNTISELANSEVIDMKFDGEREIYSRPAKVVKMGMTGEDAQQFLLPVDDLIWKKLAAASYIYFAFGDTKASVSLRGSKKAIQIFKSSCM